MRSSWTPDPGYPTANAPPAGLGASRSSSTRGYEAALPREPAYTNYPAASFRAHPAGDGLVTEIVGGDGPIEARTEGLSVRRVTVPCGARAELRVGPGRMTLAYMIDGEAMVNGTPAARDDALSIGRAPAITAEATAPTDLFVVSAPASPSCKPQRRGLQGLGDHP
jgi:redox-sensitive bicupin YhaK (pirin superfamily)